MKRTKAIEMLCAAQIPHQVRAFSARAFSAEEAAQALGLPLAVVFKTLVVQGERHGVVLAVVPGDHDLNLRKLAQVADEKRMDLVEVTDLPRLTGYLKGGVSPLGSRRSYPVFLDQTALQHPEIAVSAGLRGLQMLIAPTDLARVSHATIADLIE